jgi:DNA-directed RNA polymerase specialized sigma24 family protein
MASQCASLKPPALKRRESLSRTGTPAPRANAHPSAVEAITYTPPPWKKLKRFVRRGLTTKERLLVTLRYCERLTMAEIGIILEMPEARVTELHHNVVQRVRKWVLGERKSRSQVA